MEKLYGVPEIMDRYGCAERTARKIMREMGTINLRPMRVRESAIDAWELKGREEKQTDRKQQGRRGRKPALPFPGAVQGPLKPGQIISRVRPKDTRGA